MGRSKLRGACAVCGYVGVLTAEDVIPLWLRRFYLQHHPSGVPLPDKTILPVCSTCNGTMAAGFENAAAPILKRLIADPHDDLGSDDYVAVARWVVKTDALLALWRNHRGGPEHLKLDGETYEAVREIVVAMMESSTVPEGCAVRFGRVEPSFVPLFSRPFNVGQLHYGPSHGWVHSVLPLGLILSESLINAGQDLPSYLEAISGDDRFATIWPLESASPWPPSRPLELSAQARMIMEMGHAPGNQVGGGFGFRSAGGRPLPSE